MATCPGYDSLVCLALVEFPEPRGSFIPLCHNILLPAIISAHNCLTVLGFSYLLHFLRYTLFQPLCLFPCSKPYIYALGSLPIATYNTVNNVCGRVWRGPETYFASIIDSR